MLYNENWLEVQLNQRLTETKNRLYLKGLNDKISEDDLIKYFCHFGKVFFLFCKLFSNF